MFSLPLMHHLIPSLACTQLGTFEPKGSNCFKKFDRMAHIIFGEKGMQILKVLISSKKSYDET